MTKEKEHCIKQSHISKEQITEYAKRINRIEGQVRGIKKMIEEDRHCDDILIQISACNNALKNIGIELLLNHMKTCMVEDIKKDRLESIEEALELCKRMIK